MQFNPVYLYPNRLDVFTNPLAEWTTERYRKVYNRNLKIFRSVDNRIDIQVRNSDQKTSNVIGSTLIFNLINRETGKLIFEKDCTSMDLSTGKITVTLTVADLQDVSPGYYNYSLVKEVRTPIIGSSDYTVTSKLPLYVDSQYGVLGNLEISGDVKGAIDDSLEIKEFRLVSPAAVGDQSAKYYVSSLIDATPKTTVPQTYHTFHFKMNNYSGNIRIEGSISEGANPEVWATIQSQDLDEENEYYTNIQGKYNWLRVRHTPDNPSSVATFTIAQTILGVYEVGIGEKGRGYQIGNQIVISGNKLGGDDITNDLTITVTNVDQLNRITQISWTGVPYPGVRTFVLPGTIPTVGAIDSVIYR